MRVSFMEIARADVESIIEHEIRSGAVVTNHNVFIPKRDATPPTADHYWPCAISFFYFDMSSGGKWLQRSYLYFDTDLSTPDRFKSIPKERAEELAEVLAANACLPIDEQNPKPIPLATANGTKWNRVSWVIFVIDQSDWRFIPSSATGNAAVVCRTSEADLSPNHSFFDADTFLVTLKDKKGAERTVPAFRMINHMKGADGQNLPKIDEKFKFSMFVEVSSSPPGYMVWDIDPGGQNVGPPQPPPPPE
jgi:hypothetical protein